MDWNQGELEAMTDFAVEIGAKAHHFFFLVPTGRAKTIEEESLRAEQYEDVLTRIMKKQQEVDIELKPTCAPQFLRIADQLGYKTRFHRGCLAGLSYCIISPRVKVQPCAYLNMELGDVRETEAPHARLQRRLRRLPVQGCLRRLPRARSLLPRRRLHERRAVVPLPRPPRRMTRDAIYIRRHQKRRNPIGDASFLMHVGVQ